MQDFILNGKQISALFIIAIPVACIAWTVTHEEIFAELKNYCVKCKNESRSFLKRKFFYLFTCEYCFSHYITALVLIITKYQLLYAGCKGYFISFFSIVWVANIYMSIYARIRVTLKKERLETDIIEEGQKNIHND